MLFIIFVISLVASSILVNKAQQLFMGFMGADGMFFSMKAKLIIIVIVALFIAGIIGKIFGLM